MIATHRVAGDLPVGVHLHDTRGLGVANALAAVDAGVDRIDGTVGGLGGCPFAPGASGNLALEDLVYVLDESGVDTGIDLEALIEVAHLACGIVGRPVDSHLARRAAASAPWPRCGGERAKRANHGPVSCPARRADRSCASKGAPMRAPSSVAGVAHAYERVRAAIVENRYPPGHRLVEQRIAAELGLSRTPVREALRMLEAEGLVVSERNRGAMVRPLSSTEVEDLYGLRIRLESYAVELATERSSETELGAIVKPPMRSVPRHGRSTWAASTARRLHEANRVLHDGILHAARHRRLTTMLARTVDIPLVFKAFQSFGATEIERSDTFHHLIVEAMPAGCRPGRGPHGRAHRPGERRRPRRHRHRHLMTT